MRNYSDVDMHPSFPSAAREDVKNLAKVLFSLCADRAEQQMLKNSVLVRFLEQLSYHEVNLKTPPNAVDGCVVTISLFSSVVVP